MTGDAPPRAGSMTRRAVVAALLGAGTLAYFVAVHRVSGAPDAAAWTLAWTIAAWLGAFAVLAAAASRWAVALALAAPLPWLLVAGGELSRWPWLNLLPNTAVYLALAWMFGRTLRRGTTPLVTQLALRVHGTLPPPIERYTRGLTAFWVAYFVGTVVLSFALYFGVSFRAWSLYSNVYALPLLGAVFVGEYLWRRLRFPWFEHVSIATGIRAFTQHRAGPPEGSTHR